MDETSDYVSGTLPSRPLSPWTKRFFYKVDGREPLIEDSEIHSGLATEAPRLHPKYYADTPPPVLGVPVRQTLDSIFLYEEFQRHYLRGFESWQVGPLMRYVFFSEATGVLSGGHREEDYGPVNADRAADGAADPANAMDVDDRKEDRKEDILLGIFHSERIQVDENNWFPFLRKERWFDTIDPDPRIGGGNWSVDNPKIWEVLSISIELLNRILKSLVADRHVWMETMIFGLLAPWGRITGTAPPYNGAVLLLSQPYYSAMCRNYGMSCPIDFITKFTTEDWKVRLENLMKGQTWGFMERFFGKESVWGVSTVVNSGLILIDNGGLRRLMTDDLTVTERCFLHFNIAVTMLHELAHSIFHARQADTTWPEDQPSINWLTEFSYQDPLVDFGAASEMGYIAENQIFGGSISLGVSACRDIPFGSYREPWPEPFIALVQSYPLDPRHPIFQPGSYIQTDRVTGLYVSKILSKRFWEDPKIQRKSDHYFDFRQLVWARTPFPGFGQGLNFTPSVLTPPQIGQLDPGEAELIKAWNERSNDWRVRRDGWYPSHFATWRRTPWANVKCRTEILNFGRAFNRRDELVCRKSADMLVSMLPWKLGAQRYVERVLPGRASNPSWYYHLIGLLMLAAIPIRDEKLEKNDELITVITLFPSREAKNLKICTATPTQPTTHVINASELYDPLGRPNEGKIAHFSQEGYLDLIDNLLNYMATLGTEISMPWYREIMRTAADLRRQRRDIKRGTRDRNSWATTWRFLVPAYTDTMGKFVNNQWTSDYTS